MIPEKSSRSFSLIELLVALSALAIVAAIIIPKYLNVRQQAGATVDADTLNKIQSVYNQWSDLGGTLSGTVTGLQPASVFMSLITNSSATRGSVSQGGSTAADSVGGFGSSMISLSVGNISQIDGSQWNVLSNMCRGGGQVSGFDNMTFYITAGGSSPACIYVNSLGYAKLLSINNGTFSFQ